MAQREAELIARQAENARERAAGLAQARGVEAATEAERIRLVEGGGEAEERRVSVYRDLASSTLLGPAPQALHLVVV